MAAVKKQDSTLTYVGKILVGVFFMFLFGYVCPAWGGIAQQGIMAIGIFVGTVWMIVVGIDLVPACILSLFACLLSGFYNTSSLMASTFGSSSVVQMFFVYPLCRGLIDTGAGEFFAKWIISRKGIQGKPLLFGCVFMAACWFLGAFVGTLSGLLLAYAIQDYVKDALGYEEDSDWHMLMCMGLQTSSMIGSALLPFKGIAMSIFNAVMKPLTEAGIELNYAIYMISIIVVSVFYILLFNLMVVYVFRADTSKVKNLDITKMEGMNNLKITKTQTVASLIVLLGMLYSIVLLFIPKETGFYKFFNSIGQPWWFALMAALLCLVKVDKKPIVKAEAVFNKMAWGVLLAIAAFSAVGAMLSNNDLGVKDWLTAILGPVFNGMAFPVFMLVLIAVATIITNFFSNLATGMIIGSLVAPFVMTYVTVNGCNGSVIGASLACSCFFAYLTMASAGPAPLLLGKEGYVKRPSFIWAKGVPVMFMGIIVMWAVFTVLSMVA